MAATQIVTRMIKDAAITAAKVASNAITAAKMGWAAAKGDLIVGTAATTSAVLTVGSNGSVLTADSAQTTGMAWVTPLGTANFIFSEVPSGTINGTNPTFVLANTPTSGTVRLYVNGVRMNPGGSNDYTISTNTITFLTGAVPETGDAILADYMK